MQLIAEHLGFGATTMATVLKRKVSSVGLVSAGRSRRPIPVLLGKLTGNQQQGAAART